MAALELRPADPASSEVATATLSDRVVSVDALRGFDMFWIIGADALVTSLHKIDAINKLPVVETLVEQLEHVAWEGFHFYDLIFPLFVFLMGVSTVFSLDKIRDRHGSAAAYRRVVRRGLVLILLGIVYYGALQRDPNGPEQYRFVGVLQRIGVCYLCGGLLYLTFRLPGLIASIIVLLLGYWALLAFVPVPDIGAGVYDEGKNLTNYIDMHYLPGYKWDGKWDPEGLLSHLPAVASGLLGIFAGLIIARPQIKPYSKVGYLALLGLGCLGLGLVWAGHFSQIPLPAKLIFPVIKKLWTSSYVLVAGGCSYLLLALFYLVIDIWKFGIWSRPFVWIGLNPITIYMLDNLFGGYGSLVRRVLHQPLLSHFAPYDSLIVATLGLILAVTICWWLYARRIFVRV
jgi:predicted acyltransferase